MWGVPQPTKIYPSAYGLWPMCRALGALAFFFSPGNRQQSRGSQAQIPWHGDGAALGIVPHSYCLLLQFLKHRSAQRHALVCQLGVGEYLQRIRQTG